MKLLPVMTEKSLKLAKEGCFTFWVPIDLDKVAIKNVISQTFGVTVFQVKTMTYKARVKKNSRGKMQRIKAGKKAIVILKPGEKIDLFEEEKKKIKKSKSKKETTKK